MYCIILWGGGVERCWHHCSCVERAHAKRPHMAHIRWRQPSNISPKVAIFAGCSSAHFSSLFYGNQKTVRVLTVCPPAPSNICDELDRFSSQLTPPRQPGTHLQLNGRHHEYILSKRQEIFCLKTAFLGYKMLHHFVSIIIIYLLLWNL